MKMIRKVLSAIVMLSLASASFSLSRHDAVVDDDVIAEEDAVETHVGVLSGPSGIPMVYCLENDIEDDGVSFEIFAGANLLLPKLISGEIDIGFLPPNVAAKVYNANNGAVVIAAVAGNGMMSLVTRDQSVKSIKDLAGKTISVAGQGATPDYMMRYLLKANGIEATLDFSIPNPQIAPSLIAGKIDYAVVPEPFATVATMKDKSIIRAINIQDAFASASGTDGVFPMTVIAVNASFAKNHPNAVKKFLSASEFASIWALSNAEEAGKLAEKNGLGIAAPIATAAIPNCAYTFKLAKDAKADVEKILKIFLDFDSASIGGKLPDEGFYF